MYTSGRQGGTPAVSRPGSRPLAGQGLFSAREAPRQAPDQGQDAQASVLGQVQKPSPNPLNLSVFHVFFPTCQEKRNCSSIQHIWSRWRRISLSHVMLTTIVLLGQGKN
jgi:hypothetical protein